MLCRVLALFEASIATSYLYNGCGSWKAIAQLQGGQQAAQGGDAADHDEDVCRYTKAVKGQTREHTMASTKQYTYNTFPYGNSPLHGLT